MKQDYVHEMKTVRVEYVCRVIIRHKEHAGHARHAGHSYHVNCANSKYVAYFDETYQIDPVMMFRYGIGTQPLIQQARLDALQQAIVLLDWYV